MGNTYKNYQKKRARDREAAVAQAVREAQAPGRPSKVSDRAIARKHDVPSSTLSARLNGRPDCKDAHVSQQLLTAEQEDALVKLIVLQGVSGLPMSKEEVSAYANTFLDGGQVGRHWHQAFFERHKSSLCFKRATGLDPKRASGFNKKTVQSHLEMWKEILTEYAIPPTNIYNMDEKGIQLGGGQHGSRRRFYFGSGQKNYYRVKRDSLELVTIIEVGCADGTAPIKPAFILTNGSLGCWWDNNMVGGVGLSENGWTDNVLTEQWFEGQFIPQVQAQNTSGRPIILLLDGHGSHITDNMQTIAYHNNIFLVCLPPKTTHWLQPLDVGVFGPIQAVWTKLCENMAANNEPVEKSNVIDHYTMIRQATLTLKLVSDSWQHTGHYPVNPNIFTEADYAPSIITSYLSHMPSGYLQEVPSSAESASFTGGESGAEDSNKSDSDYVGFSEANTHCGEQLVQDKPITTRDWLKQALHVHSDTDPSTANQPHCSPNPDKRIAKLEAEVAQAKAERNYAVMAFEIASAGEHSANAHCTLAQRVNQDLTTRLHNITTKPKRQPVDNVFQGQKHGFLTAPEAKERHTEQVKERQKANADKAQEQATKEQRTRDENLARSNLVSNLTHTFGGTIAGLRHTRKSNLQDVAATLGLEYGSVTKRELYERIVTHFDQHPDLKSHARYSSLFSLRKTVASSSNVQM